MSKKKNPSDEELSDVSVEVPRTKKHRREAGPSDAVRHKHRRDVELSNVKVEVATHKQRREADSSDVRTNATRHKQRRDVDRQRREADPSDVKVDEVRHKQRRNTHTAADATSYDEGQRGIAKISSRSNDYVYDNKAYIGSLNSVNDDRTDRNDRISYERPTSVYREQYWACSKWSFAKKVLAIAAGVAMGAGIGLAVILVVTGKNADEVIGGIFSATPD